MKHRSKTFAAIVGVGILLSGCTSGQVGVEPTVTPVNVQSTTTLEFAVGTANYAGAVYFNTVETFRQAGGLSATLVNTPVITGPAGFVVPSVASAGTDAGTNHISGHAPVLPGTSAPATTFGTSGGAFAYGFAPANVTTAGNPNYPGNGAGTPTGNALGAANLTFMYTMPVYGSSGTRLPFLLAPPITPDIRNGTYPAGFLGYPSGFVFFETAPVAGTYTLQVTVPGNSPTAAPAAVETATATLTSTAGLPATPPVAFIKASSSSATVTVPPQVAGATKQVLYVADVNANTGAAIFDSYDATGGGTFTVAGLNDGDEIAAWVVDADYDFVALAPPGNTSQAPALPAQADISVSPPNITGFVADNTAAPIGSTLSVKRRR